VFGKNSSRIHVNAYPRGRNRVLSRVALQGRYSDTVSRATISAACKSYSTSLGHLPRTQRISWGLCINANIGKETDRARSRFMQLIRIRETDLFTKFFNRATARHVFQLIQMSCNVPLPDFLFRLLHREKPEQVSWKRIWIYTKCIPSLRCSIVRLVLVYGQRCHNHFGSIPPRRWSARQHLLVFFLVLTLLILERQNSRRPLSVAHCCCNT
jgi:hypothetical protein